MTTMGFYCRGRLFIERIEQLVLWVLGVAASAEGAQLAQGDDGEEWTQRVGTFRAMSGGSDVC